MFLFHSLYVGAVFAAGRHVSDLLVRISSKNPYPSFCPIWRLLVWNISLCLHSAATNRSGTREHCATVYSFSPCDPAIADRGCFELVWRGEMVSWSASTARRGCSNSSGRRGRLRRQTS